MRETQRRCVTASDYESFLSHRFGSIIQAVQCFTDNEKPFMLSFLLNQSQVCA
ncbi:baseplate wedge subunit [Klebsiella phage CPRSB]|nr:baseplate wedge subunit [Klebsiella phage CPRSB]